mmetsp:Transcript_7289/g.13285  ORF Transcript_7289/g.13285 Transcript_7289/m.13285 type:complete len:637 (-) Transcript_7289:103-2013(-)
MTTPGKYLFFHPIDNGTLAATEIVGCRIKPLQYSVMYVPCVNLHKLPKHSRGALAAIRLNGCGSWFLSLILNLDPPAPLALYKWNGKMKIHDSMLCPSYISDKKCSIWLGGLQNHFHCPQILPLEDVELYFLNRVNGPGPLQPGVINEYDSCVQSSYLGPDTFPSHSLPPSHLMKHLIIPSGLNGRIPSFEFQSLVKLGIPVRERKRKRHLRSKNQSKNEMQVTLPPYMTHIPKDTYDHISFPTIIVPATKQRLSCFSGYAFPYLKEPGLFALCSNVGKKSIQAKSGILSPDEHDQLLHSVQQSSLKTRCFEDKKNLRIRLVDDSEYQQLLVTEEKGALYDGPGVVVSIFIICAEAHPLELCLGHCNNIHRGYSSGFGSRIRANSSGQSFYVGYRPPTSCCLSSPAQGPRSNSLFQYHRRYYNALYQPWTERLARRLAERASYLYSCLDPVGSYLNPLCLNQTPIRGSRFILITQGNNSVFGYANECHVDELDEVKTLTCKVRKEISNQTLVESIEKSSEHRKRLDYANRWCRLGIGSASTCAYQFVYRTESLKDEIELVQYFILAGLGVSVRMSSFVVHMMYAHTFSHMTAMPLVIKSGKVYSKSNGDVNVFAWGAGKTETESTTSDEHENNGNI